jgi:GT2 family glycosyltransferase
MTRLDIVIVSFNTSDELAACLRSIAEAPPKGLHQTWVVDNASTDGSPERIAREFPSVRLLTLDTNVGFARANNRAIRQSDADLVLLRNSDTIGPPGAIDVLVERLSETGAVAAGPRLVDQRGRPEVSFGAMLSPLAEWRQRKLVRQASSDAEADRQVIRELVASERFVDWVSGACLVVRREAALAAGLLDERYFMYEEDVDFCAALRARGGRVLFTPRAEVRHLRGRSVRAAGERANPYYAASHLAFYQKHHPIWVWPLRLWMRLRGRSVR